jgi:hypothetical protein
VARSAQDADKRLAVETLLELHKTTSAVWIAEKAKVNEATVNRVRNQLLQSNSSRVGHIASEPLEDYERQRHSSGGRYSLSFSCDRSK